MLVLKVLFGFFNIFSPVCLLWLFLQDFYPPPPPAPLCPWFKLSASHLYEGSRITFLHGQTLNPAAPVNPLNTQMESFHKKPNSQTVFLIYD